MAATTITRMTHSHPYLQLHCQQMVQGGDHNYSKVQPNIAALHVIVPQKNVDFRSFCGVFIFNPATSSIIQTKRFAFKNEHDFICRSYHYNAFNWYNINHNSLYLIFIIVHVHRPKLRQFNVDVIRTQGWYRLIFSLSKKQ